MAVTPLSDAFRGQAEDQPSAARLISCAVLLEQIAQTQEVLRASCIELSDELAGLAEDPALRERLRGVRTAFARPVVVAQHPDPR